MKALAIALTNLKRFFRDRTNVFFVFILPIGLILLIGSTMGNAGTSSFGVYPGAAPGAVADRIVAGLEERGFSVEGYGSAEDVRLAVERGEVTAGVAVPDDLDARLAAGDTADIAFYATPNGQGAQLQSVVDTAAVAASETVAAVRFAVSRGADRGTAEGVVTAAAAAAPTLTVTTSTVGEELFEGATTYEVGSAGELILFMFITGLAGSAELIETRRLGISRRMLGTPTSAGTVLAGEALGRLVIILMQAVYIVVASALLFQVDWGNLLATGAVVLLFALVAAGASMLFGTLFSTPQQSSGAGIIVALALAALGGAMLPIELFSPTLREIAKVTPHFWAVDAFSEVLRRGGGLADILPQLGVLAAFAVVLITVAAWRMRAVIARG